MAKVLVTGATGFIGSYVINELLSQGHVVVASSSNQEKAKSYKWFDQVIYKEFNLETFDNNKDYYKFFEKPDAAIHLAWEGLPNYKESFHIDVNLPRHYSFLSNLVSNGLKDLTVTGTCFEYGMQEGKLDESMEVHPDNPYAIAKNELRIQIEALQKNHQFPFKWVRLFYMYGEGQSSKSLFSQLEISLKNNEQVFNMSGGEQVRDYLPVEKVSEYIVKIAGQNGITGVINCCSGKPITVKDLVEQYLRQRNKTIQLNLGFYPYPNYEPMRFWGDNKKLQSIIV